MWRQKLSQPATRYNFHMNTEQPYRVMITGSREITDASLIRSALSEARARALDRPMVIVHGCARGADSIASKLAEVSDNAQAEPWPALWRRAPQDLFPNNNGPAGHSNPKLPPYYRDEALYQQDNAKWSPDYDRAAGFARNEAMLESGIDEVLAFLKSGAANRGTKGAINAAKRMGLTVYIFEQE